ncbi:MAG: hypothetical protein IJL43_00610 [Lachnospiraceae bacterium]|nr:hypothetical protein [Lachnospiraceae bacterium]
MIIIEQYEINGRSFTKTYSDAHRYVVRDGVSYAEANDPTEFGRTYEEGDKIPYYEEEVSIEEAFNILMGGEE